MLDKINKRAQAGELVQDTACLIIIAFLIFMLFVVAGTARGWSKKEVEVLATEQSKASQAHHSLYAWLQQSVQVELEGKSENITIADLIRLSQINSVYKETLDSEMHSAFDPHYSYIFRSTTEQLKAQIEALQEYPRFYIPSNQTILVVLQLEKVR